MISSSATYMFGIQGKSLSDEAIQWLQHPLTAGVILFTRNYESREQIKNLIQTLRATAKHDILIAVDQEGGRVQRFREGFTAIPCMAKLGELYNQDSQQALQMAKAVAYIMAHEIATCDVDFSFAPVLDIKTDISQIIGDRAFHSCAEKTSEMAHAFYTGMRQAGLSGVGKHFPGHGYVTADSHLELPVTETNWEKLQSRDLVPFHRLIKEGIEAIMPAHILYTSVDGLPAGFSNYWLQSVLRKQMGFTGCIISDDLDMAGAAAYGSMTTRIELATHNCDLILLCNQLDDIRAAFNHLSPRENTIRQNRLEKMKRDKSLHSKKIYHQYLKCFSECDFFK